MKENIRQKENKVPQPDKDKKKKIKLIGFATTAIALIILISVTSLLAPVIYRSIYFDLNLPIITNSGYTSKSINSHHMNGTIIYEFTFTWCTHCENMYTIMKALSQLPNVTVISIIEQSNLPPLPQQFLYNKSFDHITYVFDTNNTVYNNYKIQGTPTFYITKGDIAMYIFTGEQTLDTLLNAITHMNKSNITQT